MSYVTLISLTQAEFNALKAAGTALDRPIAFFITDAASGAPNIIFGRQGQTATASQTSGAVAAGAAGGQVQNNFASTVAPTVSNDGTQGYAVGSRWVDTAGDESYICVDSATGAAVWSKTTVGTIAEVSGLQAALDLKAPLVSPAFTGSPTAPTAAVGVNTTQVATTAFVQAEIAADLATATPLMNGTAAVGTSVKMAREDHVHASDTTKAPLASPTFTGTVIADGTVRLGNGQNVGDSGGGVADSANVFAPAASTGATTISTADIALRVARAGSSGSKWPNAMDVTIGSHTAGLNASTQVDFRLNNGGSATPDMTALTLKGDGSVLANGSQVVRQADVVNTLVGTSTVAPLSAAQGKTLKDTADLLAITVGGKALAAHAHAIADVTNLQTTLDAKQARTVYTSPQDANNLVSPGVHVSGNGAGALTNGPSGNSAWSITVSAMVSGASTYIHQLFSTDNNDMYTRKRDNGTTWSTWTKVLNGTIVESDVVGLPADLAAKQATLVSGTNIKTLNSQSILGSGDIAVAASAMPTRNWDAVTDAMASRTVHFRPDALTAGVLASWPAAGGTSVNGTQATGADQPTVTLNSLNSLPTVGFDTTDNLDLGSLSLGATSTVIAVALTPTAANANMNTLLGVDTGNGINFGVNGNALTDSKMRLVHNGVAWLNPSTNAVAAGWHVLGYTWDAAADTASYFTDGSANGTAAYAGSPTVALTYELSRRSIDGGHSFNSSIAEVLIFQVVLSATERQKAEGYLAWKYGLQANLPVGHTYKNAAPTVVDIPIFATNAAAVTGGRVIGQLYRTGADPDVLCVVH